MNITQISAAERKICKGKLKKYHLETKEIRWKNGKPYRVEVSLIGKHGLRWPESFDPEKGDIEELKLRFLNRIKTGFPHPESPDTKHSPLLEAIREIIREELDRVEPPGRIKRSLTAIGTLIAHSFGR